MSVLNWVGRVCFLCKKRFWSGGGLIRITHADLDEQEYEESPICEPCAKELERAAEVGKAMRGETDGQDMD